MRRLIIVCLALFSGKAFSQDYPQNQVNLNILNAIVFASVEVGYERYVGFNQSIEVEMFFNDRFSYFPNNKNGKKYNATSIKLGYNYYFDLDNLSGPYINPFIKQRFGNFKETKKVGDQDVVETTKLDSFILGIGVGYIWNYNDTFVVAPYVNIGRNFGKEVTNSKYFWAVEPNAGIKIGYKF